MCSSVRILLLLVSPSHVVSPSLSCAAATTDKAGASTTVHRRYGQFKVHKHQPQHPLSMQLTKTPPEPGKSLWCKCADKVVHRDLLPPACLLVAPFIFWGVPSLHHHLRGYAFTLPNVFLSLFRCFAATPLVCEQPVQVEDPVPSPHTVAQVGQTSHNLALFAKIQRRT